MEASRFSLNSLLKTLNTASVPDRDTFYSGIAIDSRKVQPGDLFIAVPGALIDGRYFIQKAIDLGAIAVLAEQNEALPESYNCNGVYVQVIPKLQRSLGDLLHHWFRQSSDKLTVVGVTGTNGKTSCSFFIAQALKQLGLSAGVIGTIGKGVYPDLLPFGNTTPGLFEVHETLQQWVKGSVPWSVIEVTSHALCQGRVDGVHFDTALFTNISRDHLDYHASMDDYVKAKSMLFSKPGLKYAVINIDDVYASVICDAVSDTTQLVSYSLENKQADIYLTECSMTVEGVHSYIVTPWGGGIFKTSLLGRFNLYNLLGVAGVLGCHGFSLADILEAVEKMGNVPGRMAIYGGRPPQPQVIVDYSHTPDALVSALSAIREQHAQGVTCIFGCGGDRDKGKRPLMMKAALDYADHVVLTSDNPRFEDPQQIINDALAAVPEKDMDRVTIDIDRKKAIENAIFDAKATDVVFLAGKGHEDYQDIQGIKHHLDDSEEVKKALDLKVKLNMNLI